MSQHDMGWVLLIFMVLQVAFNIWAITYLVAVRKWALGVDKFRDLVQKLHKARLL